MSHNKKPEQNLRPYKMAAQSVGALVCLFFVLVILGKMIPETSNRQNQDLIPLIPFLLIPVAGYVITWFSELAGAIIMLLGGILLLVYFVTESDISMALLYGIPFIIAGTLFLLHVKKRAELKIHK